MRGNKFHSIEKHNSNSADRFEEKKLSVGYCHKKLRENGLNFTEKEVELIRDFLYLLAEIEYEHYKQISHEEEGNPLHSSIN
jgi:hypothetical protein